jgi:hypothetical protein
MINLSARIRIKYCPQWCSHRIFWTIKVVYCTSKCFFLRRPYAIYKYTIINQGWSTGREVGPNWVWRLVFKSMPSVCELFAGSNFHRVTKTVLDDIGIVNDRRTDNHFQPVSPAPARCFAKRMLFEVARRVSLVGTAILHARPYYLYNFGLPHLILLL